MNKDELFEKAYSQAMSNAAISHCNKDVDFLVIKNDMAAYLEKHGAEFSEEDLVNYIKAEMKKLSEAMIDFTFSTKMMN